MLSGVAIDIIAKSGMNSGIVPICAIWVVTRLIIVPMSSIDIGAFLFFCKGNLIKGMERDEHY